MNAIAVNSGDNGTKRAVVGNGSGQDDNSDDGSGHGGDGGGSFGVDHLDGSGCGLSFDGGGGCHKVDVGQDGIGCGGFIRSIVMGNGRGK